MSNSLVTRVADDKIVSRKRLKGSNNKLTRSVYRTRESIASVAYAFEQIRRYTQFDRIRVFRFVSSTISDDCRVEAFLDSAPPVGVGIEPNDAGTTKPYGFGLERWKSLFARGETVGGRVSEFPATERVQLEAVGLQFLVAPPIARARHLWGFVSFESRQLSTLGPHSEALLRVLAWAVEGALFEEDGLPFNASVYPTLDRGGERSFGQTAASSGTTKRRGSEFPQRAEVVERSMASISRLLVQSRSPDIAEILRTIGTTIGALRACVVRIKSNEPPDIILWQRRKVNHVRDHRSGTDGFDRVFAGFPREDHSVSARAVPILSSDRRLMGYVGFEYGRKSSMAISEVLKVPSMLSDLLAVHFERSDVETAYSESEERWKTLIESHPDPLLILARNRLVYVNGSGLRLLGAADESELRGWSIFDFLSASDHGTFEKRTSGLERGHVSDLWEHEVIRVDGEHRTVESCCVPIMHDGELSLQIVLRDITDQKGAEESYRKFFETVSEGILRIDVKEPLPIESPPDVHVAHILKKGVIVDFNSAMTKLVGRQKLRVGGHFQEWQNSFIERILQTFCIRNENITNESFPVDIAGSTKYYIVSCLGSIKHDRLESIWICCLDRTYSIELEKNMIAALEAEQHRIGRDLHDGVGQLLTGIRILGHNLSDRIAESGGSGIEVADKIAGFADKATGHIRDICAGLSPVHLDQQALREALEDLVGNVNALPGVTCVFNYGTNVEIRHSETKVHLYRIIQEAVNNSLKHSGASHIQIRVWDDGSVFTVRVEDDGKGVRKHDNDGNHIGFHSMEYRAHAISAKLSIRSRDKKGTAVECTLNCALL